MDDIRNKYNDGEAQAREAFEELCAMVDNINSEREERRETAKAKVDILRTRNVTLRQRNANLRAKYAALVEGYNNLATAYEQDAKDRSDSSSSSDDSDGNDDCSIM